LKMNNRMLKGFSKFRSRSGRLKLSLNFLFILLLTSILSLAGVNIIKAQLTDSQEASVSATVQGPTATATATATATPTASPSISPTPISSPIASPVSIPTPTPAGAFKIYGYAPSNSEVFLSGIAVSEKTISDSQGYFEFTRLFFPTFLSYLSGFRYPELCLFSLDESRRLTSPVCIPPLPLGAETNEVGPILLSPTLNIEKGTLLKSEQAIASGKTVPNSEIEIYLAREKTSIPFFDFIKEVSAYTIPLYQISSDDNGDFEFNLPNDPDTWRLFAGVKVLGSSSAKSNTLMFNVYPPFYRLIVSIINFFKKLFLLFRPDWIYLIILLQIVIIILLIKHLRRRKVKRAKKPSKRKLSHYDNLVTEYKRMLKKKV
jgi:hypothetical protein